ncbi:MAG: excinuclease ABC subunit UvrA, partial [Pseudomonadota bacterium]|nr:excinuclease ABC subunit UvrA [Pseudomonadota bacterium]
MLTEIAIQGAREHNLKDISVTMPRDKLIVITGLSGSGKSSLAFDTIYAEGQRRYVESLSAYARQFLELMQKPDVDQIEGLSPAISIEQKTTSKNPRSTVGTVTEIYDYMRLLWARVGIPYSPATGKPIESQSASQMVDRIMAMDEGTKLYILAPIVRGRKGEYRKELQDFARQGFQRVRIDGEFYEMDDLPTLNKKVKHDIDIVIDRLIVKEDMGNRLADSVETGLRISDGLLVAMNAKTDEETLFSEKFACPISGFTIAEIEPRMFSFNNPHGACPQCDGLGMHTRFDPNLVVPDHSKSLGQGAVVPWSKSFAPYYMQALETVVKAYDFDMDTPWRDLSDDAKEAILHGTDFPLTFVYKDKSREFSSTKPFEGVITSLRRRMIETESQSVRDELSEYQSASPCKACDGHRLKEETRAIKICGKHIGEITELSIENAHEWFDVLPKELTKQQNEIAHRILKEIVERLTFLRNVGLDYLTLSRTSGTLSGGESQRIRLASQIGSGLTGVLYVLDEPSIGLHQRDNNRLLETLTRLRDLGNTVIVVEHDEDAIRSADHVIDMGPGAGIHGGTVVAEGTPADILKNKDSITGQYLNGTRKIDVPTTRRSPKKQGKKDLHIDVIGARGNNLKNVTASYPLGVFTCVTGVSGSGKSTLTLETLYKAAARKLNKAKDIPAPHDEVKGLEHLDKIIDIDQSPIGRTPRSNP